MKKAAEAIATLESFGYEVKLKSDGKLNISLPAGYTKPPQAKELMEALRADREEAVRILLLRSDDTKGMKIVQGAVGLPSVCLHGSILDAFALKRAMDAGEIVINFPVVYDIDSLTVIITYTPLVPPEWIDLRKHRDVVLQSARERITQLQQLAIGAAPEYIPAMLEEYGLTMNLLDSQ